jgi:Holliday junction resolvase-like predicted endonuclease
MRGFFLKIELLVLIPESESFCTSKKSFIEFLKVDSLIGITGQRISYKRSPKAKELAAAKFRIETDLIKSKQERYFLIVLEALVESSMDDFNELCDKIRSIAERISPGKTTINTLWDDVGRAYAERSYPLINEVENLMRRLIAKFMLITVGVNWSRDTIHPDLFKKIDNFSDDDPYVNDLFKLDFIHLKEVLFGKKRDLSTDELDRLLSKTKFSSEDCEVLKKYLPKSNWEKYFSSVIDEDSNSIDTKWALLYKLRNKVAHNRHVKRSDFEKIKGLCEKLKEIINKASAKLGEIDINEEDRDLIIYAYNSDSPAARGFLSEKATAEYYINQGYTVSYSTARDSLGVDLVACRDAERIGVEVKSVTAQSFSSFVRIMLQREMLRLKNYLARDDFTKVHLVILVRDGNELTRQETILKNICALFGWSDHRIDFKLGSISEDYSISNFQEISFGKNPLAE